MDARRSDTPAKPRKPYHRPTLRNLGRIRDLTRGGVTASVSDHGSNSMRP